MQVASYLYGAWFVLYFEIFYRKLKVSSGEAQTAGKYNSPQILSAVLICFAPIYFLFLSYKVRSNVFISLEPNSGTLNVFLVVLVRSPAHTFLRLSLGSEEEVEARKTKKQETLENCLRTQNQRGDDPKHQ